MNKMTLQEYFDSVGYNWKDHEVLVSAICKLTKTRVRPPGKRSRYGTEQQHLINALAIERNVKRFFEIGTGRGTTSFILSRLPQIEHVTTIDILPFDQKRKTAVNYVEAHMSNKDFYDAIPFKEKLNIEFITSNSKDWDPSGYKGQFDMAFIDGNHDAPKTIMRDFYTSEFVVSEKGIILFDDYNCEWGSGVTKVVDDVVAEGDWDAVLVEFRGHLFEDIEQQRGPEKDQGLVILRRKNVE